MSEKPDNTENIVIGTGRWYKTISEKTGVSLGKLNINDNVAKEIPFENRQEVVIAYNKEKNEFCVRPLKYCMD